MRSMEEEVLEIFFEQPTKHWHFTQIKKIVPIADNKLSNWLKKFIDNDLIKKIKPDRKMPYYISNYQNVDYQNKKKMFSLKKMHESGLINHLCSLKKIKTIFIFGSFVRWDWHSDSDIDIFIYGNNKDMEKAKYEEILNKEIHIFNCKNKKELRKFSGKFLKNVIKGHLIKGDIDFLELNISA